jgi:uncharacterized protein YndB with AHSA1/START domain
VFRRVLADPVDAAWSAMTESDRLGRWFGTYNGTGRVGGTVELLMTAAEDAGGPPSGVATLECAPRERLVGEVTAAGASESWRIGATLSPEGDATVLVFDQLVPAGMRPASTPHPATARGAVRSRRTPQRAKSGWPSSTAPVGLGTWGD